MKDQMEEDESRKTRWLDEDGSMEDDSIADGNESRIFHLGSFDRGRPITDGRIPYERPDGNASRSHQIKLQDDIPVEEQPEKSRYKKCL